MMTTDTLSYALTLTMSEDDHLTGPVLVLTVAGNLTHENRHLFKQAVLDYLDAHAPARIVVDLTDLGYIDSSGLGVLVSVSHRTRTRGGQFLLCGMNDDLTTLFELTKMDTLFFQYPDRTTALTHFEVLPAPLLVAAS